MYKVVGGRYGFQTCVENIILKLLQMENYMLSSSTFGRSLSNSDMLLVQSRSLQVQQQTIPL